MGFGIRNLEKKFVLDPEVRGKFENLVAFCGSETKGWSYLYQSDIVVSFQNIQPLEV
jgi:hypothetical protein